MHRSSRASQFVNFCAIADGVVHLPAQFSTFGSFARYQLFYLRVWDTGIWLVYVSSLFDFTHLVWDLNRKKSWEEKAAIRSKSMCFIVAKTLISQWNAFFLVPVFITHIVPVLFLFPLAFFCILLIAGLYMCYGSRLSVCIARRLGGSKGAHSDLREPNEMHTRNIQKAFLVLISNIVMISLYYHAVIVYTTPAPLPAERYFGTSRTWWELTSWRCYISRYLPGSPAYEAIKEGAVRHIMSVASYILV